MKKRILILGGYGFMGINLNKLFVNDERYDIFNESRRTGCDVLDLNKLQWKIKKINPDIIINAAANVGSIEYVMNHSANIMHDNSQMHLNLYKVISIVNKNIIIINPLSNCSYPGHIDIQHENLWWDGPLHKSIESYGTPKKLAFTISECYEKQYGIKTLNLILPNAYGENDHINPNRTHAMSGIIMRMIQGMKNGDDKFVVWGSGEPIREWIYMPDAVKIIKYIIDNEYYDIPNPINLGQEMGISIKNSVLLIKKMLNYNVEIIFDISKPDGAPVKILGSRLFKKYFPDFKFTPYEEGLQNAITYYKEQS
jgi:GDP-L-fucose synthase